MNEYIKFGHFPQTATGDNLPIEWLVLKREKNKALVISRYVLTVRPFHKWHEPVLWGDSTLMYWLDSVFPLIAFSQEEKDAIIETNIPVATNITRPDVCDSSMKCSVFILDAKEAAELFPDDEDRLCIPTPHVIATQNYWHSKFFTIDGVATTLWWLRTTGKDALHASFITVSGHIEEDPEYLAKIQDPTYGVRPAMWVDLDKLSHAPT